MSNTTVTIQLQSANARSAGSGHMVIGDAIVDGKESDVIFWDPAEPDRYVPGATIEVAFGGKDAQWVTRGDKTSFQVRPAALISIDDGGGAAPTTQPIRPTTQPAAATHTQTEKLDYEQVARNAAEMTVLYYNALVEKGAPPELCVTAAAHGHEIYPLNWFGEKK